ncbi:hypothetical protein QR680_013410 [Steinernema hermaphroditum]|uniref:Uncharacterized protein n=1 Tax=Steinernema hermaphroditum TaxID=289476 RepID=A0AA39I6Y9_9BILA|nr:hypothetical protein QR680_013410 [Steinernema hermaphroditum]
MHAIQRRSTHFMTCTAQSCSVQTRSLIALRSPSIDRGGPDPPPRTEKSSQRVFGTASFFEARRSIRRAIFPLDLSPFQNPTMSSAKSVAVTFAFCVVAVCGQTFETGDNSTVRGCSTHCRIEDPTMECWNQTLHFFERVLLGQMRHYIAVQINIDQWHRRHDHHYVMDFEKVKKNAFLSMESHLEEDDLLNKTTVEAVLGPMIDRVADESSEEISWVPHFSCPLPCEHRSIVWRNLFIASMVLNVCLAIAVVPFIVQMVKHDNAHASESLIR